MAADRLGLPVVVKIPDGSFSRGVHKADTLADLRTLLARLFKETDFLLAQSFMPTRFDWRVGVLGGRPLFVCQYHMAKKHWQIIKHEEGGPAREGGSRTLAVADAPREVVETAVAAAGAIGEGLYGVDVKSGPGGPVVIEVNDNPNMDTKVEGLVLRERMWTALLDWFLARLDAR
jgi:glutathione synthase/RimK-type ligase-like ATP-grasp enzyme